MTATLEVEVQVQIQVRVPDLFQDQLLLILHPEW